MVLEIIVWVDCCFIIMQLDIKEQSLILEGKKYSRKELVICLHIVDNLSLVIFFFFIGFIPFSCRLV